MSKMDDLTTAEKFANVCVGLVDAVNANDTRTIERIMLDTDDSLAVIVWLADLVHRQPNFVDYVCEGLIEVLADILRRPLEIDAALKAMRAYGAVVALQACAKSRIEQGVGA